MYLLITVTYGGFGLLDFIDIEVKICCYPIERRAERNQGVYMQIIAFHHRLQAV